MTRQNGTGVTTTVRSLDILDELQRTNGATARELVEALDLSKSTVHAHLNTLQDRGYVWKRGELYRLGMAFYNKGQYVRAERSYLDIAEDVVDELDDVLDEDIEFVVENAGRGMITCESYHDRSLYDGGLSLQHQGAYFHLHTMAAGKAIMAYYSESHVREIADEWGLPAYTEESITDVDTLLEELDRTQERGYALSDEEFTKGLRAVAYCIEHPDGTPLGALSVCVPIFRTSDEVFHESLPKDVGRYAAELEKRIHESLPT